MRAKSELNKQNKNGLKTLRSANAKKAYGLMADVYRPNTRAAGLTGGPLEQSMPTDGGTPEPVLYAWMEA